MASQLVWFELPVSDVDRAKTFFGDLLGWELEGWGDQPYYTVKDASPGGALLPGDGRPVVYFASDDLDGAVEKVRALGGEAEEIQQVPGVGRMCACRDDQGTRFSLYQPES
jgi:predicted enzyme related to lactoylglutathione lyase